MIEPHPDSAMLRGRMERCLRLSGAWVGTAYRFVTVAYGNRQDLLSGAGSRLHGGRWNPPGRFNVVYGSLTVQAAVSESLATAHGFGIPPAKARPRVFAVLTFDLQRVLDLTAAKVRDILNLNEDELRGEDWKAAQDAGRESTSQALGRLAWELKLEAILVPSAAAAGERNIAVFPGRRLRGSSWRIQGARDLPRKR